MLLFSTLTIDLSVRRTSNDDGAQAAKFVNVCILFSYKTCDYVNFVNFTVCDWENGTWSRHSSDRNLRKLRRDRGQTQAEMAKALNISTGYVNLLENNQRSLSVKLLTTLTDVYDVDWRDLVRDESSAVLAELRTVLKDPLFGEAVPDLQELRASVDHAPTARRVVSQDLRHAPHDAAADHAPGTW